MSIAEVLSGVKSWHVECADVLAGLRLLPDGCVQTVCTSPPYYGLRDYGTGTWEGGDPGCDHKKPPGGGLIKGSIAGTGNREGYSSDGQYPDTCRKCGARRIDRQLGLEPTPAAYVARLVEVFREVRRILRDDGIVFLNLGDSYASSSSFFPQTYRMREDLTDEEKQYVALEMFGMRFGEHQEASEGAVSQVLPPDVYHQQGESGPVIPGQGVEGILPAQSGETDRVHAGETKNSEVDGYRQTGREVRLLRRNSPGISNGRSHQRRRGETQKSDCGEESGKQCENLQGHTQSGLSERQVSSPLLQLQLFHRLLGILSTQAFKADEIPEQVRFAFIPTVTLKPKDLLGIPWMVAFALRDDGWYLRSDIIWSKPNPMPESVTDRPTKSHEYLFLLAKRERYFYDAEAIKESAVYAGANEGRVNSGRMEQESDPIRFRTRPMGRTCGYPAQRNRRTVWEIPTQAYPGSHFATFAEKLVEPCILAGSSQAGCCPRCGAPWQRVVERTKYEPEVVPVGVRFVDASRGDKTRKLSGAEYNQQVKVTGETWQPTCPCPAAEPVPCLTLDPFAGSGTTLAVSVRLGRRALGVELNSEYMKLIAERVGAADEEQAMPLFDERVETPASLFDTL